MQGNNFYGIKKVMDFVPEVIPFPDTNLSVFFTEFLLFSWDSVVTEI